MLGAEVPADWPGPDFAEILPYKEQALAEQPGRAEWGGLLMFHGNDGNIEEAFTPAMGALRIFAVPALHSVSYVTPLAPEPRLSITGWLRSSAP